MLPGDICKCIANFDSNLPGELLLYKNDIIQIHKIIDKIWLEGEAAGSIGRFPSSIVVKIDPPSHDQHLPLFVATADFDPVQDGDLPLRRGDFIIGLNEVDQSWWYGESCGRKGVFPANFVWRINKGIISDATASQEQIRLRGKALRSVKAQLPEEIDLVVGDIVTISNIVDDDWYRGICNGREGIFPKSYIEIIEDGNQNEQNIFQDFLNSPSKETTSLSLPSTMKIIENDSSYLPQATDSNVKNTSWINYNQDNDDALFEDDYFKQNMPSMYKPSSSSGMGNIHKEDSLDIFGNDDLFSITSNYYSSHSSKNELNIFEDPPQINSISAKVDDYFNNDLLESNSENFKDLLDIDFKANYTEDNTGINPYGRAIFSFSAQYMNELSFKKGDVIHLIKHIDSHWTVGRVGDVKGIFPTSYIDIIVNCPYRAIENFEKKQDDAKNDEFLGHAIVCDNFVASNDREIDVEQGDIVVIKRFTQDNWVEIQKDEGSCGKVPLNYLKISEERRNQSNEDFESLKTVDVNILSNNLNSLSIEQNSIESISKNKSEFKNKLPPKNLPPLPPRPKLSQEILVDVTMSGKENSIYFTKSKDSTKSNEFPDDVRSISSCEKVEELAPKRPAPPPPLNRIESEFEDEEDEQTHPQHLDSECLNEDDITVSKSERDNADEDSKDCVEILNNCDKSSQIQDESSILKKMKLRRESVNEMVTTEYEYIHDLEALIQVVKISRKQKEASSVDLKILLGNIVDVIKVSKKFVHMLDSVSYQNDAQMMIGPIFNDISEEICEVYKVYSSNNSLSAGPLLAKYQEGGEPAIFLKWILHELRNHKVNLLDLQAVLIKPVQRVLKYPLFIDQMLRNTPTSHLDYKCLEEARKKMLNVAKEINEYTKRLDLVTKYRSESGYSFGEIIQRVSMRSVAKKSSRFKTRISATIGLINQTRDLKFEEEEAKFHSLVKATTTICEQGNKLIGNIRARHKAELAMIESVATAVLKEAKSERVEAIRNTCRETCCRLLPMFESVASVRVVEPAKALLKMCSAPERLILKRYDKLLDYDTAQHRLDKNKDPSKTRVLEEELQQARGVYEALNKQLLLDLPILNNSGVEILILAMKSLVSARMKLEGHIAKLYLDLAQLPDFSFQDNPEYLSKFKTEYTTRMGILKKLHFLPPDLSVKSPKFVKRKSSFLGRESKKKIIVEKETVVAPSKESKVVHSKEAIIVPHRDNVPSNKPAKSLVSSKSSLSLRNKLMEQYGGSNLYLVESSYKASDQFELNVKAGTVVGVIKKKDPLGKEDRWFIDDGENKGFVKSSCLKKFQKHTKNPAPQRTNSITHALEQASTAVQGGTNIVPEGATALPATSYPSSQIPKSTIKCDDSKSDDSVPISAISSENQNLYQPHDPNSASSLINIYSKDIDRFNNRDMTDSTNVTCREMPPKYEDLFPISEVTRENIPERCSKDDVYEEIPEDAENIYENLPCYDEPIYEAIGENELVRQQQPDTDESKFYYALYNFGGSDANQLDLYEGQVVMVLFGQGSDWWFVEDRNGSRGYVPASYLDKYE